MLWNRLHLILLLQVFAWIVFPVDAFVCSSFNCASGKTTCLLTVTDKIIIGTITSCGDTVILSRDSLEWSIHSDSILAVLDVPGEDAWNNGDTIITPVLQLFIGHCFFERRRYGAALQYFIRLQKNELYADTARFLTAMAYEKLGLLKPALASNFAISSDVRGLSKEAAWQRYRLFRQFNVFNRARKVAEYISSTYPSDTFADSCRTFLESSSNKSETRKTRRRLWIPDIKLSGNSRYGIRTSTVAYDEIMGNISDVPSKDSSELRWAGKLKVQPQWDLSAGRNNRISVQPTIVFNDPASNMLEQSLEGSIRLGFKRIRGFFKGHSAELSYKKVQHFEPYEFDEYRFRMIYAAKDLASYSLDQIGLRWNYMFRMKRGLYGFYSIGGTLQKSPKNYFDGYYYDATMMLSPLFSFGTRTTVSLWTIGIVTSFPVIGGKHTMRVFASGLEEGKSVTDTITVKYYTDSKRTTEQSSGSFFTGLGSKPKASSAVRYAEPSESTVVGSQFSASYCAPSLSVGISTHINKRFAINIKPSLTLFFYKVRYSMDNADKAERYNGDVIIFINDDGGLYITNDIDNGSFTKLRQEHIRRWDLKSGIECSITYTHRIFGNIKLYMKGGMVRSSLLNDKRIKPEYEEVFGGLEWKRDIRLSVKKK